MIGGNSGVSECNDAHFMRQKLLLELQEAEKNIKFDTSSQEECFELTKTEVYEEAIVLFVATIKWDGHEPVSTWIPLAAMALTTSIDNITKKRLWLLKRKKYFVTCCHCQKLKARGWMHGDTMCSSCAEHVLDVVY